MPNFNTLEDEAGFWESHSITDYLEYLQPVEIKMDRARKDFLVLQMDIESIRKLKNIAYEKHTSISNLVFQLIR